MRLLPLLLFLSACAAPSGAYMDGAPLAPPEPRVTYTPTGTGLPEYWGTPEAPKAERSPHKRELPPTREPGLWAGDGPTAVRRAPWAEWPTTVLGVDLPLIPGLDDQKYQDYVRRCAYAISRIADEEPVKARIDGLTRPSLQCLIARLNAYCAWEEHEHLERLLRKRTPPSDALKDAIRSHHASAERLREKMCAGVDPTELDPLVLYGTNRWPDILRGFYAPN